MRGGAKEGADGTGGGGGGDVSTATELLKIYNTTNKQWERAAVPVPENQKLVALHFSPDGRFQVGLFIGSQPHRDLRVFRMQDQGEMFATKTDLHGLAPITFSPDGKSLLFPTPPDEKGRFAITVVNIVSGAPRATFPIDLRTISQGVFRHMAFTPDGNFVYGHQADHLFVWNVATGQLATEWNWLRIGDIAAMGCTPDSRTIRALMEDGTIASIDLPAASNVRTGRLNVPPVPKNQPPHIAFETSWSFNRAAFTQDGASVLRDAVGRLDVFDMQSGNFARTMTLPSGAGQVDFTARQGDLVPVHVRAPGGDSVAIVRVAP